MKITLEKLKELIRELNATDDFVKSQPSFAAKLTSHKGAECKMEIAVTNIIGEFKLADNVEVIKKVISDLGLHQQKFMFRSSTTVTNKIFDKRFYLVIHQNKADIAVPNSMAYTN